jgi:prevent-host-death family protein
VKSLTLAEVTGSLSEYARRGLREPVVVTKRGRPVVAVMPLTKYDDWESVSLSANPKFMAIIERSRASARTEGTLSLDEVRRKYGRSARHTRGRRSSRKR